MVIVSNHHKYTHLNYKRVYHSRPWHEPVTKLLLEVTKTVKVSTLTTWHTEVQVRAHLCCVDGAKFELLQVTVEHTAYIFNVSLLHWAHPRSLDFLR